jgi:flagellar basal-body rod modification protein FlgD
MTTAISPDIAAGASAAANRLGGAAPEEEQVSGSRTALASDFDTFLKLLTTQMRNQDPLKPLESTEFVAQLAQFSSVEQQIATNKSLTSILEAVTASNAGSLADWLGREVRAAVPVPYSGRPVDVTAPEPSFNPKSATLLVIGPDGKTVAEQDFKADDKMVTWNGKTRDGTAVPHGTYSFAVRFGGEQGVTETHDGSVFVRVTEAQRQTGDVLLKLAGGGSVLANEVQAVRNPASI